MKSGMGFETGVTTQKAEIRFELIIPDNRYSFGPTAWNVRESNPCL